MKTEQLRADIEKAYGSGIKPGCCAWFGEDGACCPLGAAWVGAGHERGRNHIDDLAPVEKWLMATYSMSSSQIDDFLAAVDGDLDEESGVYLSEAAKLGMEIRGKYMAKVNQ